jgi:hypothetical protein
LGKFHSEAAGPQVMPELLAEQHLNIWLVVRVELAPCETFAQMRDGPGV